MDLKLHNSFVLHSDCCIVLAKTPGKKVAEELSEFDGIFQKILHIYNCVFLELGHFSGELH